MNGGNELAVSVQLRADTAQFTGQLKSAAQAQTAFVAQAQAGNTAAQALGGGLGAAGRAAQEADRTGQSLNSTLAGQAIHAMKTATQMRGVANSLSAGVIPPLRMLAPLVTGAGAAISAAVGGVALLAKAYASGAQEAQAYTKAIVMSGNAAGTSAGQLADMARAISAATGTQGAAAAALAQMAASGRVASQNLQAFTQVAMGLEKAVGIPVEQTVAALAELAKAPLEASIKLNEQYHYLTASVYEQIKALEEQGRREEAAALAQKTFANEMGRRKDEVVQHLGTLERAWNSVTGAAKAAWDAMKGIGRDKTDVEKIKDITTELAALNAARAKSDAGGLWNQITGAGRAGSSVYDENEKRTKELIAQAQAITDKAAAATKAAQAEAENARKTEARIKWDQEGEQFKTKAAKRDEEIRKAEIEGAKAIADGLITEADLRKRIADIREKYKDPPQPKASTAGDSKLASLQAQLIAAQLYHQQLQELGAAATQLNAGERESLLIGEQIKRTTDGKTLAELRRQKAVADTLGVVLRAIDVDKKAIDEHQKLMDAIARDTKNLDERAAAQERANTVFGMGRAAIESMTLAELERQAAEARASGADAKYIVALEKKIEAQKRWAAAWSVTDYKTAEAHADELLRNAQELNRVYAEELQTAGLTALEREKLAVTRQIEIKYAKELAALDAKGLSDAEKQALRAKIVQAQRMEAAIAVSRAEQQWIDRASEEISNGLTDALQRGFEGGKDAAKNFLDSLKNLFKTQVLRLAVQFVQTGTSQLVGGVIGFLGGNSGGGGLGSLVNLGSSAYSAYGMLTGTGGNIGAVGGLLGGNMSFANTAGSIYANGVAGLGGNSLDALLASNGAYGTAGSAASALSAVGTAVGAAAIGYMGGSLISNGYSTIGNNANTTVAAGTAIGATVGSIFPVIGTAVGALVGGLAGGVVNRLFGHKLGDTGIEGDFGGATGFEGQSYQFYKGGWFSSDKTKHGTLDEEVRQGLAGQFNAMRAGAAGMAGVLGLGTEAIDNFSAHIKVSLKGLSDDEATTKIKEEFDRIAESLASATLGTTEYTRSGEGALETLTRLSSSLAAVNTVFDTLNRTLYASSLAGADMASQLIDLFGGADNFGAVTGAYFKAFYSEDEQREAVRRSLQTQLSALGLALPDIDASDARDQWRALADAQDLATEAGRQTWAMLLSLSDAFAGVTLSADDAARAAEAAAKAEADAARAAADALRATTDAAWASMQQAIQTARDAAQAEAELRQERVNAAQAVVDLAREQARDLRGLVDSTVTLTAARANTWIDHALQAARATGNLPDAQGLSDAIAAARAGLQTSAYSNRQDYEAAQLILANKLETLGETGAAQLGTNELLLEQAKKEVDRLDMLLKGGREALDEARGNTVAVKSVEEAIRDFHAALFAETGQESAALASPTGGGIGVATFGGGGTGRSLDISAGVPNTGIPTYWDEENNRLVTGTRTIDYNTGIPTYLDGSKGQVIDPWLLEKWKLEATDPDEAKKRYSIGFGYANGGMHAGGWRLVGEEGPEVEFTGPSRIMNARQMRELFAGGGSADVVAAIEALQRQTYDVGRAQAALLQSIDQMARKADAIGVLQREAA